MNTYSLKSDVGAYAGEGLHCRGIHIQDPLEQVKPPHSVEQLSQVHRRQLSSLS